MKATISHRLAKLEATRWPRIHVTPKADRDAAVAMALADPEWFHQIGMALLGDDERPGDREHHAAILAAWRADT